jgi:peptidyl-prolyl cis-trans isomerase SurA
MTDRLRFRPPRRGAALLALSLAATLAQAQLRAPGQRPAAADAARGGTAAPAEARAARSARDDRNGDYIVAVVNQELVTAGEVQQRIARVRQEAERSGAQLPPADRLRQQVLDALIDERVQITYARETAPRIDEAEVDRAVANVAAQNQITLAQLRERLRREGIDYGRLRANLREQIMVERVREREVQSRIQISDREIDALLDRQRATAGSAVSYNIAQVLVTVPEGAVEAVVAERRARAEAALARIRGGEAFEQVAREVSEDGNRARGGEIGLREADRLPDVFVDVVRPLQAGQVAPALLRTAAGFHVLKLLDRREGGALSITQTHARHILLRPSPQLTQEAALRRLTEFKRQIEAGGTRGRTFEQLAREYSQDASAAQGGDLGWASPGMFVPEFEQTMNALEPGAIAEPIVSRFGVHLIQVLERRRVSLDPKQQREQARNVLREQKFDEAYLNWARELRARAYVEMREPPT